MSKTFGDKPGLGDLMKKAQEMQKKMQEIQKQIADMEVTGQSGGLGGGSGMSAGMLGGGMGFDDGLGMEGEGGDISQTSGAGETPPELPASPQGKP